MTKLNAKNERLKRDYFRFQKEARGKSIATIDAMRKAISRFEDYTGARDFKTFHREQAIGFKKKLAETEGLRTAEVLSSSTQVSTLNVVKEFFIWLAWQPGFKSKIHLPDTEYFALSRKDNATARATKLRDFPSLEQVQATIVRMPIESVVERRNRALIAFTILTGMRDSAIASLCLRHIDLRKTPPLVRQEPDRVNTKFSKSINTYFFPIGDDLEKIVTEWVNELRTVHLFAPNDPVFPRTKVSQGEDMCFRPDGIEPSHWANASPIRDVFKRAFEQADLPYFPPHSFRHTLGHLMQTACRTPEQMKAWSQNLGHEGLGTTLMSYGKIDGHRQGEVIAGISLQAAPEANRVLEMIRTLVQVC